MQSNPKKPSINKYKFSIKIFSIGFLDSLISLCIDSRMNSTNRYTK